MHIVHLSSVRDYYGGEVCLANLAEGLSRRGQRVTCVVRPDSRLLGELQARGVAVQAMPLVDWYEPVTVARLGCWLRDNDVDILHTHRPRDWFIAAAASVGSTVANVGTRHLLDPVSRPGLKRPFLKRFGAMIAVSRAVRRGLLDSGVVAAERIVTVPNGIRPAADDRGAGALRRRAGVGPDELVVGMVGRLSPEKGIETLMHASAALLRRWPRLRVFVLGDAPVGSPDPEILHRLGIRLGLESTISYLGYVEDAARHCADFDVQVVCSQAEPFGLATLEAMAQARPVVVTDSGGSPEIVRDGVEGFLVPPNDAAALARRLDCLLDSPGLRVAMGQRGRQRLERRFDLDRMLDRTDALYRRLHGVGNRAA